MSHEDLHGKFPSPESFVKRFAFIENETLRDNVVITFRYIASLIVLENEIGLPGTAQYSMYKDMIVHTVSVVEACIIYCLKEIVKGGAVASRDIMPFDWEVRDPKDIVGTPADEERVIGARYVRVYRRLDNKLNLVDANRAAKRAGLFDAKLFELAEELRQTRNRIHLFGLTDPDDTYRRQDVDRVFNAAKTILEAIETKLASLRGN